MEGGKDLNVLIAENQEYDSDSSQESSDQSQEANNEMDPYLRTLKTKFSHDAFREKQLDVIRAVIEEKKDVCVIMATGAGKSLCFQFPAVHIPNGITLVICPLISLMETQVRRLMETGISACLLGSAQRSPAKTIFNRIGNNEFRVIYCTPEYFRNEENFNELCKVLEEKLTLIAFDEAHVS